MRSSHGLDRLDVTFDGTQLVADAGLLLPATLAQHLGLEELVEEHLDLGKAMVSLECLFLIHRYRADSVHYVSPTEDNKLQTQRMEELGLYCNVVSDIGDTIVADVNAARIAELLAPDRTSLVQLIAMAR